MDFGVVDNLLLSTSATAHSNNGGSITSQSDADVSKLRLYGYASHTTSSAEDDLPPAKAARISSGGGETAKAPPQGCHDGGALNQQMLGFSSANNAQNAAFAFVRDSSGLNGVNMNGLRGPFTPSQWIELEHQAMIYKYITANLPIPSHLLIPISKAIQSSGFPLSLLRPNGWTGFHLGLSKTDPEPDRCRRTDGKKWRCSREAVVDQKYCERHMNRGRNRSRKPVEGGVAAKTTPSTSASVVGAGGAAKSLGLLHHHQSERKHTPPKTNINRCIVGYPEFGSVCSDSLLNPLDRKPEHAVRQFIDEWPKNFTGEKLAASPARLSREYVTNQIGVGVGNVMQLQQSQRQSNWVPIAWENSGGPLGEALHTATNFKNTKSLIGMMPPSLPAL